ncbi:hypothetical protein SBRCBS47491_001083 [Sporothrix bragantina]|uniref:Zn(2)-C6 fungal-type domain-containing protein n=1 Tax=Sporothrix bragantina TaxID=671064 RepID=A0ABP0AVL8_9PEZI
MDLDHHALSPVPLSDGTARSIELAAMSDLAEMTDLAHTHNTADAIADAVEVAVRADSIDMADAQDMSDTPAPATVTTGTDSSSDNTTTAASPSSDAAATPGSHQPGSSVRRRSTATSASKSSSSTTPRLRTRAGTGRPLKINYPKKRVSVACDVCRARKTRCDARRPACSFCSQLGIECVYRRGGSSATNKNSSGSNSKNGDGLTPNTPGTPSTPKNDNLSKTDIVARLGRLESLLREKESAAAAVLVSVAASTPAGPFGGPSPSHDSVLPSGNSPIAIPPPTPSPIVSFSAVSPYASGNTCEQYVHYNHQHYPQQQPQHRHHGHVSQHQGHHHQHHHQPHDHHESLSPYVATTTPSDHGVTAHAVHITAAVGAGSTRPSPLFGYRLDSLSRLGPDAASLPSLRALCHLDVNAELETELFGQSTADTGLLSSEQEPNLDLSPRRCWSLEQAFSRDVLPWCPIIEQQECAELVARAAEDGFPRGRLETAVALLVLALGSFARESGSGRGRDHANGRNGQLPGIEYFHAGRQVVHTAAGLSGASGRYSIMRVQCDLLVTFYFLFSLKPILAFEVLSSAGLRLLMLLQLRSSGSSSSVRQATSPSSSASSATTAGSPMNGRNDPTYDERLHRAYWTCYLLEHELQAYVSFSARLLQERRDFVPLPLSNYEEPGMYWFLSEIALRGICSSMQDDPGYYHKKPGGRGSTGVGTGGVAWNEHMLDAPMLVEEVTLQLLEWHANLAAPVSFPLDDQSAFLTPGAAVGAVPVLRPLLDPHKVFLRAQFYAVQATLRWPFVVQLLTDQAATVVPTPAGIEGAAASLHYAVLHVYAVEPLLQDRHLMLFANIAGLFCVTMLLLCAHNLPQLAAIQHPGTEAAVRSALTSLRIWQGEPNVQAMVVRVEELARANGVAIE